MAEQSHKEAMREAIRGDLERARSRNPSIFERPAAPPDLEPERTPLAAVPEPVPEPEPATEPEPVTVVPEPEPEPEPAAEAEPDPDARARARSRARTAGAETALQAPLLALVACSTVADEPCEPRQPRIYNRFR